MFNASIIFRPEIFANAYHWLVDSNSPERRYSSFMGCLENFGYMHELQKKNFSTLFSKEFWIRHFEFVNYLIETDKDI